MKKLLLFSFVFIGLVLNGILVMAQSKPVMGYDKVVWGVSVDDVRKSYNIGNEIQLLVGDSDPNIAILTQENVSESVKKREFYFNKWNSNGYRLYRVWVYYVDEENSNNNAQTLMNMLTEKYSTQTRSYSDDQKVNVLGSVTNTDHYLFEKYAPDLTVEMINTKLAIYFGQMLLQNNFQTKICYTWTKVRDSYQASQRPKIQL